LGVELDQVRTIYVVTIDADLSKEQLITIQTIFQSLKQEGNH